MTFVLLNHHRTPVAAGKPEAGVVKLFISRGHRVAVAFDWKDARNLSLGFPVPALIARLLGWRIENVWEPRATTVEPNS